MEQIWTKISNSEEDLVALHTLCGGLDSRFQKVQILRRSQIPHSWQEILNLILKWWHQIEIPVSVPLKTEIFYCWCKPLYCHTFLLPSSSGDNKRAQLFLVAEFDYMVWFKVPCYRSWRFKSALTVTTIFDYWSILNISNIGGSWK